MYVLNLTAIHSVVEHKDEKQVYKYAFHWQPIVYFNHLGVLLFEKRKIVDVEKKNPLIACLLSLMFEDTTDFHSCIKRLLTPLQPPLSAQDKNYASYSE